jgi:hypothetical protein
VSFSIAICLLVFNYAILNYTPYSLGWFRLIDISFWVLFLGSLTGGLLDLSLYWRKTPILSTILQTIIGVSIIITARISSMIYSLLKSSFYTQVIGGSIIDEVSYKLTTISILGSFMILASTIISTWYKKPIVFRESPTLHAILIQVAKHLGNIKPRTLYILLFLIGFTVRLYPELKYPSLPVGWDTLEYISNARDFAYESKLLTRYIWLGGWRNLPPLLTWISGSLAVLGIDPQLFFKVYPSIMVGLLSMLSAMITHRLTKSKVIAITAALLTVFNPYVLGQSQQWHRHMLGLVFLMAYLYFCESKAKHLHRAFILVLGALAYEPVAVLALFLSIAETLLAKGVRKLLFSATLIFTLLVLLWYVQFPQTPVMALTPSGVYVAGNIEYNPATALNYTITCLLLLSPSITIATIWRSIDVRTKLTIVVLFLAFIAPALCVIAPIDQHRWFTILLSIITPYTVAGLTRINKNVLAIATILIVLLGSAYPFTENGFEHFRIWAKTPLASASEYPWKLEPALKNLSDVEKIAEIIALQKGVILVSLGLYPQIHLYIRNPTNIVPLSREPTLITAIAYIATNNLSKIITVTSTNMSRDLETFREKPDLYNTTLALQLGEEYKQLYIGIESVRVELLYRGATSNIYIVEINKTR